MKRTFKSLLAVAGLAFIGLGSLLTAAPAQAYTTRDSVSNGITCKQFYGEAYPHNYNFYYCASQAYWTTTGNEIYVSSKRYNPTGANPFGATMSANNIEIFVFENMAEFQTFFGYLILPPGLSAESDAFSEFAPLIKTPNTTGTGAGQYSGIRPRIVLFRARYFPPNPPYPQLVVPFKMPYSLDHEVGHFIDRYIPPPFNGPRQAITNLLVYKPPFVQLVEQDKARLVAGSGINWVLCQNVFVSDTRVCSNGAPKAAFVGKSPWEVLEILNPYYFTVTGINTPLWAELWAGEVSVIGAQSSPNAGFSKDINNLMPCSRLWVQKRYVNGTVPLDTEITGTQLKNVYCKVPKP
ncbi:MAG: hypothetical protein IPK73_01725 [Candidatus Obscuribacter sp.]|nr:hypothetical protein [Candidatus Obscuribacter sp.]MBK9280281.1 hypothetical protein [Candidatus Obscuribacter sp.]